MYLINEQSPSLQKCVLERNIGRISRMTNGQRIAHEYVSYRSGSRRKSILPQVDRLAFLTDTKIRLLGRSGAFVLV